MAKRKSPPADAGDTGNHEGGLHDDWRTLLLWHDGKMRERSARNAYVLFRHHPEVGPSLAFDTFSNQAVARAALPWDLSGLKYPRPIGDNDGVRALGWLEQQALYKISMPVCKDSLISASRDRPFNPLVEWLQSLVWDQTPRIEKWLSYYLGAEDTPYTRAVGPKFLVGAVARGLQPGCKLDTMLILEGPQGQRKSSAVAQLFGPSWFTDDLADIGTKDAALQMQGKWGIEVSEMSSFSKAETNRIKAALSRRVDRFRAPYERFVAEHPRQCVLVGTTNPVDGYFKDPTGGRRFWPVTCGTIDVEAIEHDREQLWAEAVHRFENRGTGGSPWWLAPDENELAKVEQRARMEVDPWETVIRRKLADLIVPPHFVLVNDIMQDWLSISVDRRDKGMQMRVAAMLKSMGWTADQKKVNGVNERIWWNPDVEGTPAWKEVGRAIGDEVATGGDGANTSFDEVATGVGTGLGRENT